MRWFTFFSVLAVAAGTSAASAAEGFFRDRNSTAEGRVQAVPASQLRFQAALPKYADFPAEAYPAGYSSYRGLGYQGSCCECGPGYAQHLWAGYCSHGHAGLHLGGAHCAALDGTHPGPLHRLAAALARLICCKRHQDCGYQKGCSDCAAAADVSKGRHPHGGPLAALFHCRKHRGADDCYPPAAVPGGFYGSPMYYGGGYVPYEGGQYEYSPMLESPMPESPEAAPNGVLPPPPPPLPQEAESASGTSRGPLLRLDRSARRAERRERNETIPLSY